MEWATIAIAAVFVSVAGIIRGFAGFGAALAMVPPLSGLFGPTRAVALVAIIESIGMLQLLPNAIRHADWRYVAPLALTAVVSVPIGVSMLVTVEPRTIEVAMALVVLLFVVAMSFGWQRDAQYKMAPIAGVGVLSGFLAGATGMAGPPVILYLLSPKGMSPANVRASLIVFFAMTGLLTLVSVLSMSEMDLTVLYVPVLLLAPMFMLATHIGATIFTRSKTQSYRSVALVLLAGISLFSLFGLYGHEA